MIEFTVRPDGQPSYRLVATTRDVVQWEKTTKGASLSTLKDAARFQDLYKIAWFAAVRQGKTSAAYEEFEASVDIEFELEEDAPEGDPTLPGLSIAR